MNLEVMPCTWCRIASIVTIVNLERPQIKSEKAEPPRGPFCAQKQYRYRTEFSRAHKRVVALSADFIIWTSRRSRALDVLPWHCHLRELRALSNEVKWYRIVDFLTRKSGKGGVWTYGIGLLKVLNPYRTRSWAKIFCDSRCKED